MTARQGRPLSKLPSSAGVQQKSRAFLSSIIAKSKIVIPDFGELKQKILLVQGMDILGRRAKLYFFILMALESLCPCLPKSILIFMDPKAQIRAAQLSKSKKPTKMHANNSFCRKQSIEYINFETNIKVLNSIIKNVKQGKNVGILTENPSSKKDKQFLQHSDNLMFILSTGIKIRIRLKNGGSLVQGRSQRQFAILTGLSKAAVRNHAFHRS